MQESARHLADGFGEFGVRMPQNHAHHAGSEVVVFLAVHIDELGAPAGLEDDARRVAPAEHGFGIARLEIRMHVREAKALLHFAGPSLVPSWLSAGASRTRHLFRNSEISLSTIENCAHRKASQKARGPAAPNPEFGRETAHATSGPMDRLGCRLDEHRAS